jgi:hypothetical protein
MQILEIVLYSRSGARRVVNLRPGQVNIITGGSGTGKSALSEIVDYCLGRGSCEIPEGVIRDTVSWYAVRIQFPTDQLFIARENPITRGHSTGYRVYIEQGDIVESPISPPLTENTNLEGLRDLLTRKIGIAPNLNTPPLGQTRQSLEANIRHALTFCYQQQTEIAAKDYLFHRQYEAHTTQDIKDTLPYFLGVIQEDRLAREQELVRRRRELRIAQRELVEAQSIQGEGLSRAVGLLSEARETGLLPAGIAVQTLDEILPLLRGAVNWTPDNSQLLAEPGNSNITELQEEERRLAAQLRTLTEAIDEAKRFAAEAQGYANEMEQQTRRLEAIGLFNEAQQDSTSCPLCAQPLDVPVPTAQAVQRSLSLIQSRLTTTTQEPPRLREYIQRLENERADLRQRYRASVAAMNAIFQENRMAEQLRDLDLRRSRVLGRISFWLENLPTADASGEIQDKVRRLQDQVSILEESLDSADKEQRLLAIQARLGVQMTQWAQELELEHSGNPVWLDYKNLTVFVSRGNQVIPLSRVGSGENWVGYHLITHLALHQYFEQETRPVPRFLFLDQPSQVYYPAERDSELAGSLDRLADDDRSAVLRMFQLMFRVVSSLAPNLQLVVTEHADLADDQFQSAILERWRDGQALIPQEWISELNASS